MFIVHKGYTDSTNGYLYGIVCTISGKTITAGTDTQLSSTKYSSVTSAVALNENKVFIVHRGSTDSTNYYPYGIVCTISGTTITAGTDTRLNTNNVPAGSVISAVALNENKAFVAYGYNNYNYLYGIVCTISGKTITAGTGTQLNSTRSSGSIISAVALNENKVFIAYSYDGNNYPYGIVCTISGTTITAGTHTQLSSTSYSSSGTSAVALNENKVFIVHRGSTDSTNYYPYGIVCTISGTTITAGTDTQLSSIKYSNYISAVALNENKVFIVHWSSTSSIYYLYGIVCTISGTTITAGTHTQLSTNNVASVISAVALNENKVFIAYSYNNYNYLYGIVCRYLDGLYPFTSQSNKITGIAKQSGTSRQTVQVYVPNV